MATTWCKKEKREPPEFGNSLGMLLSNDKARVLLWVNPKQKPDDVLDTIIHESVHAYQYLVRYIGENVTGDEYQAYTIAHIATQMIKEYRRQLCLT